MRVLIDLSSDEVVIEPVYSHRGSSEIVNFSIEAPGVHLLLSPLEAARFDLTTRQVEKQLDEE